MPAPPTASPSVSPRPLRPTTAAPTSKFSLPLLRHCFVVSSHFAGKTPNGGCPWRYAGRKAQLDFSHWPCLPPVLTQWPAVTTTLSLPERTAVPEQRP